jgi:hypothetical protein
MSPPKTLIPLVFAVFIAQNANVAAQTTSEDDAAVMGAITQRVESFFGHLKNPSVNAANTFSDLLADGPLDDQPEQLKAFVDSYGKLEAPYGRFLDAKQVGVKRVGDDLTFLTYLYETERFPIVWRIAFYRPPIESLERPDWFVVHLSFDTKLEQLLSLP